MGALGSMTSDALPPRREVNFFLIGGVLFRSPRPDFLAIACAVPPARPRPDLRAESHPPGSLTEPRQLPGPRPRPRPAPEGIERPTLALTPRPCAAPVNLWPLFRPPAVLGFAVCAVGGRSLSRANRGMQEKCKNNCTEIAEE